MTWEALPAEAPAPAAPREAPPAQAPAPAAPGVLRRADASVLVAPGVLRRADASVLVRSESPADSFVKKRRPYAALALRPRRGLSSLGFSHLNLFGRHRATLTPQPSVHEHFIQLPRGLQPTALTVRFDSLAPLRLTWDVDVRVDDASSELVLNAGSCVLCARATPSK